MIRLSLHILHVPPQEDAEAADTLMPVSHLPKRGRPRKAKQEEEKEEEEKEEKEEEKEEEGEEEEERRKGPGTPIFYSVCVESVWSDFVLCSLLVIRCRDVCSLETQTCIELACCMHV